ncbi:MAG: hypothetical protein IPK58_08480 [Acidobacteria bacterium]|nr:hypothetical protein [Acidobacteriota bacterium]
MSRRNVDMVDIFGLLSLTTALKLEPFHPCFAANPPIGSSLGHKALLHNSKLKQNRRGTA